MEECPYCGSSEDDKYGCWFCQQLWACCEDDPDYDVWDEPTEGYPGFYAENEQQKDGVTMPPSGLNGHVH